jgi:tetratricopeptide (TPR) repeat protein
MGIERMIKMMLIVFGILIFANINVNAESQLAMQALKEAQELKDWYKYDEAIAAYRKIVNNYPRTDEADQAQIEIGNIYAERGMFDEAIREYQKVIDQYSQQIKRSISAFQSALSSKEPQPIDVKEYPGLEKMAVVHRANKGIIYCYLETNRYDKAMEALQEEIRTNNYPQGYAQFQIESLQQEIEKRKREEPEKEKIRALLRRIELAINSRDLSLIKECYTDEAYKRLTIKDEELKKMEVKILISQIDLKSEMEAFVKYFVIVKDKSTGKIKEGVNHRFLVKVGGRWRIK